MLGYATTSLRAAFKGRKITETRDSQEGETDLEENGENKGWGERERRGWSHQVEVVRWHWEAGLISQTPWAEDRGLNAAPLGAGRTLGSLGVPPRESPKQMGLTHSTLEKLKQPQKTTRMRDPASGSWNHGRLHLSTETPQKAGVLGSRPRRSPKATHR